MLKALVAAEELGYISHALWILTQLSLFDAERVERDLLLECGTNNVIGKLSRGFTLDSLSLRAKQTPEHTKNITSAIEFIRALLHNPKCKLDRFEIVSELITYLNNAYETKNDELILSSIEGLIASLKGKFLL